MLLRTLVSAAILLVVNGIGQANEPVSPERIAELASFETPVPERFATRHYRSIDGPLGSFDLLGFEDQSNGDTLIVMRDREPMVRDDDEKIQFVDRLTQAVIDRFDIAGLQLVRRFPRSIQGHDFSTPLDQQIVFRDSEGRLVFVHKRSFFGNRTYEIGVTTQDRNRVGELLLWAEGVGEPSVSMSQPERETVR